MINLTLNEIRELTNDITFRKGFKYYQNSLVKNLHPKGNNIIATVYGSEIYEVILEFNRTTGNLIHTECDCPAYYRYGPCKHIIATLLKLLYTKEKLILTRTQELKDVANNSLINSFASTLIDKNTRHKKQAINMEITIEPNSYYTSFSLRLGLDKLYVLKDCHQLINSMMQHTTLYFGQHFTFDGSQHTFTNINEKIIRLILDFYNTYDFVNPSYFKYNDIQNYNKLKFPDNYLKKLFTLLEQKPFNIKDGLTYKNQTIKHTLDMHFRITQRDNKISIQLKNNNVFYGLTHDNEYVYYNHEIIKLDTNHQKFFSIIEKNFNTTTHSIVLDNSYKHEIVSAILPVLKKMGHVTIDENMDWNIYMEDIVAEIYLDKYEESIKGTLNFYYGEYKKGYIPQSRPELPENLILFQNLEAESKIISLLEEATCIVHPSREFFTITEEEALYDFIYDYLPKLQKLANVYYSDDFKNLHIKIPHNVQGGIRLNDSTNMLEFSFNVEGIDKKELAEIFNSLTEKKKYYKLKSGSFLPLDSDDIINISELIDNLQLSANDLTKDFIEIPKYRALYIDALLREKGLNSFYKNQNFKKLVQDIKEPQDMNFKIPKPLDDILRDYQKFGFKWLKTLSIYGLGGILADDMGLGKTLQAITLVKLTETSLPSLVVAPTSLVYNWEDEINKFAPDVKVAVISGNKNKRRKIFETLNAYDIIITSYGLLKRDIEAYQDYNFEFYFIDEAQHIKNPNSLNAKSVKLINANSRFALTGTPIENSLTELWSIFDFIMPGYLFSHYKFCSNYERPIVKNNDKQALNILTNHIKPFLLRRLKTDVLKELPPKIETKVTTELLKKQKKVYLAYLEQIKSEVKSEISLKGYHKSTMKILAGLTRLRQICCHPSLFLDSYTAGSSKLELLEELVTDAIESGHRILVFSQFTSMLSIIQETLDKNKISNFYLDGNTKAKARRDMVHAFNNGESDIFLISLKAGGTGLNLTGADMVIHYDPWWNPAVEDQATDRAYRIGQDKSVQVIKLITAGTIEEKIYQLQQKKKSLTDLIIRPGETLITKLSEDEIMNLFEL